MKELISQHLDEHLEGPSAIAISKDDATAPARILCKFAKNAKALELKAGVVEGTLYDTDALNELAKIPSRDELLANCLEASSPLSQTWLAFSTRSQKKVEQMLVKQLRQQRKLQRHQQLNTHASIILFQKENNQMEENKMAKLTTAEFIDAIKELSVLELNDLVKACEEELAYPQQQVL